MEFIAVLALIGAVLIPSLTRWYFDYRGSWTKHVNGFQAVLTVTALGLAAGWFLIERPDAAKLEVTQTAAAFQHDADTALVLVEIGLKNIGGTALDLRRRRYSLTLQRVSPTDSSTLADMAPLPNAPVANLRPADRWATLAVLDDRPAAARQSPLSVSDMAQFDSYLEAGETENYYYRALVPCSPDLRLAVTLQMPKPSRWFDGARQGHMWWVKQTLLDVTDPCKPGRDTGR